MHCEFEASDTTNSSYDSLRAMEYHLKCLMAQRTGLLHLFTQTFTRQGHLPVASHFTMANVLCFFVVFFFWGGGGGGVVVFFQVKWINFDGS